MTSPLITQIFGKNYRPELHQIVPREQLLPTLGGTSAATLAESFGPWTSVRETTPTQHPQTLPPSSLATAAESTAVRDHLVGLGAGSAAGGVRAGPSTSGSGVPPYTPLLPQQQQQQRPALHDPLTPAAASYNLGLGSDKGTESGSFAVRVSGDGRRRASEDEGEQASAASTATAAARHREVGGAFPSTPASISPSPSSPSMMWGGGVRPTNLAANGGVFATVPTAEALAILNE